MPHLLNTCAAWTAVLCLLFLPCLSHVTVTHTTSAPDNGDQPYTAFDDLIGPGYTGYLSSSDRLKVFQGVCDSAIPERRFTLHMVLACHL
jgi:hypothetical protein